MSFGTLTLTQMEEYEESPEADMQQDGLVMTYNEHDDSIYSVAWGDAW